MITSDGESDMRYIIFMQLITGEIIKAFTWRGVPELGIFRAKSDARERGIDGVLKVWASPVGDFLYDD
jgi:hypothetical protein